ncbi:MAG: hypothetical protein H6806_11050 [Planctomycetes bacterium]|nr:hypothetical protein [Myxococcales bacterium]MCB9508290.1 hypothetical protein [Myxococcales bacterium]MCB9830282.1 hypothetical protein [Planctomycetota bacterium]
MQPLTDNTPAPDATTTIENTSSPPLAASPPPAPPAPASPAAHLLATLGELGPDQALDLLIAKLRTALPAAANAAASHHGFKVQIVPVPRGKLP